MPDFVKQLSDSRKFKGQITAPELSHSLEELAALDKASERTKLNGCLVAFLGVVVIVVGIVLVNDRSLWPVVGWFVAALGLGVMIWGLAKRAAASRTDFEDRRYLLLGNMNRLLSVDVTRDSPLDLQLNLQAVDKKSKRVGSGKAGIWNVDYYEDPWLNLHGDFRDGTKFSVLFIEKYQYRHRKKRSASGKIKHKSKTKSAVQAVVSVKPKEKRYPGVAQLGQQARGAVQLPRGAEVKDLSTRDNVLTLKAARKGDWNVDGSTQLLSQMLLSLYQVLNLAKKIDKSGSSNS